MWMAMALCVWMCVCAAYGHAKDLSESRTDDNDKTGQGQATLSWPALRILSGRCRVRTECDLKASPKLLNATSVSVSVSVFLPLLYFPPLQLVLLSVHAISAIFHFCFCATCKFNLLAKQPTCISHIGAIITVSLSCCYCHATRREATATRHFACNARHIISAL